jgi:surface antigen
MQDYAAAVATGYQGSFADFLGKGIASDTDLLPTERDRAAFNQIVGKYNSSPLIQAADRTVVLKNTVEAVRQDPSNGTKQLSLAYGFIQALDTYQSAVREGELGLVNSIDSKVGQLQNYVQQIQNGQTVRPEVANEIANAAESLVNYISEGAASKEELFRSQARVNGIEAAWDSFRNGFVTNYDDPTGDQDLNNLFNDVTGGGSGTTIGQGVPLNLDLARSSGGLTFNSVGNTSASTQLKGWQQGTKKMPLMPTNPKVQQKTPTLGANPQLTTLLTKKFPQGSIGPGKGVYEGQCGVFVREAVKSLGLNYPMLGDSLTSKTAVVKKHGTSAKNARIGSVIVTKENPTYGHVAYIIGMNEKGWIVAESNFRQSKRVDYGRVIPFNSNKVVGIINPTKA